MIYLDHDHASWIGFCQRLLLATKFQSPQDADLLYSHPYLLHIFVVVRRIIAVDALGRKVPYEVVTLNEVPT